MSDSIDNLIARPFTTVSGKELSHKYGKASLRVKSKSGKDYITDYEDIILPIDFLKVVVGLHQNPSFNLYKNESNVYSYFYNGNSKSLLDHYNSWRGYNNETCRLVKSIEGPSVRVDNLESVMDNIQEVL